MSELDIDFLEEAAMIEVPGSTVEPSKMVATGHNPVKLS